MDKKSFFLNYLSPAVRLSVDISRFLQDDSITVESVHLRPADLAKIFLPWYVDEFGVWTGWEMWGARSLTVPALLSLPSRPEKVDWAYVEAMRDNFDSGEHAPVFPAFALTGTRYLILDGNHRLTALVMHARGAPVELTLAAIQGPVDESFIPDLRHWTDR